MKSVLFSDRECSLFSVSLSFGGEGRGREARLDECCISNGVCLESVGALPPFIGNNHSTPRMTISRLYHSCLRNTRSGCLAVGRWMLPRGTSVGLKCLGHLPHFQYSKSISKYSKSNSGYSESNGQTAKIYRTGRVPCIAKQYSKNDTVNTSIRGLCR